MKYAISSQLSTSDISITIAENRFIGNERLPIRKPVAGFIIWINKIMSMLSRDSVCYQSERCIPPVVTCWPWILKLGAAQTAAGPFVEPLDPAEIRVHRSVDRRSTTKRPNLHSWPQIAAERRGGAVCRDGGTRWSKETEAKLAQTS